MVPIISSTAAFLYQNVVKPVYFKFDAEEVHDAHVFMGEKFGGLFPSKLMMRTFFGYQNSALEQTVAGIHFTNPIGLSAGFDYDAHLTQALGSIGFGFQSVGTLTAQPHEGNATPRLGRLPKSQSLLVNKGYKNGGVDAIVDRLKPLSFPIPLGVSVGSLNEEIDNFITCFEKLEKNVKKISYYELNISCPNLKTGEPFMSPATLKPLLMQIDKLKLSKPIFIKMPCDLSIKESLALLKTAEKHQITGAIFGNLTKDRKNPDLVPEEVAKAGKGNFSGKPTEKRSNALLAAAYKEYGKRFVFIGCGGVFNAQDAYTKIKLGATLVQMITGMIFQGPQVIGQINRGLVDLLHEDGFENISQAIGKDLRKN